MATLLLVDDSPVERRRAEALLQKRLGPTEAAEGRQLQIINAANGREALNLMAASLPDLVITDLIMPDVDGLELVQTARLLYPSLPVVLMTAHGNEDVAARALRTGATGYVPKKHMALELADTVSDLLHLARAARERRLVVKYLQEAECRFVLDNNLELISPLVAYLLDVLTQTGSCEEADRLRVTVALREALVNAFTHGNLEVSSEVREGDPDVYRQLVAERSGQPPYQNRRVHVLAQVTPGEVRCVIRDEGPGFNPSQLPDPTDPANLAKPYGRGLLLIRSFMDEVRFNAPGNEITLIKRRSG